MSIEYHKSNDVIFEKTFGEWTVNWWQWALSAVVDKNPVIDKTGKYASENQPQNVFFLAGIFAEKADVEPVFRECIIPSENHILVPVANCEADTIYDTNLKSDEDIIHHVSMQVNGIAKKEFYINNISIQPQRVRSEPIIFEVYIHPDLDNNHKGGYTKASADGYWIFLKPLPLGEHTIKIIGSFKNGQIKSEANYKIKVL